MSGTDNPRDEWVLRVLGVAVKAGTAPPVAAGSRETEHSGHGASHPAAPVIAKAKAAWVATRQKIDSEIAKLTQQFEMAFDDHHSGDEIVASFKERVDSVLQHLDQDLAVKLDEVNGARDATQRAKLVDEAHALIARYSQHIASDETIKHLDENPLVPMQLGKMLTATLTTLSKSVR